MKIHSNLLNFIRPSEHSTFSPSSMGRIIACPFSVKASEKIPQETSVYAEEGTLCHSVCEAQFQYDYYMMPFTPKLNMDLMAWEADHPGATAEMQDCANIYVNAISAWLKSEELIGKVLFYGLERGIPIFPEDGCFGTADCLIVGEKGCAVIDYKHGKGQVVKADSMQLRTYAAGVARHLIDVPEDYQYHSVIVQPRTTSIPSVASYNHAQMIEHLNIIQQAIQISHQKDLYPVESKECFWCPARRTKDMTLKCQAIKNKAVQMANEDFGKFLSDMSAPIKKFGDPNDKRDTAIIKIISLLPLMQKIASEGEEEFMSRLEKGEIIPGLQVIKKESNRKWIHNNSDEMEKAIKQMFPKVEAVKTVTSLKTITEIEKIVGKGKADKLTMKTLSNKLKIQDKTIQEVLGEMAAYGNLINMNEEI